MSPIKPGLTIPALLRPILPTLAAFSLIVAACSSSSDDPLPTNTGGQTDHEPAPHDNEVAGAGGAAGSPAEGPSDVGGATAELPGSAGTPAMEPGAGGGSGGSAEEPGVPEPTPEFLRGQALAEKNTCASCHQADFGGFTAFPNITPDQATGIGSWTDEEISKAIRNGVDKGGGRICETMQRFPFSDEEMADMIAFLRGLPPVERVLTADCP